MSDQYGRTSYDSEAAMDDDEHRHTHFLDLTNGEGGDHIAMYYEDEDDEDDEFKDTGAAPPAARRAYNTTNTNTSRVVESGQEHTGRWTREEHEAFLSALSQYGKEWKKVAAKVKTRTVVQTRTHAQKYFQKLQKSLGGDAMATSDTLDNMAEGKKASAQKKRMKARLLASSQQQSATEATTSAAHLLTQLPSIPSQQSTAPSSGYSYPTTHGFSAASAISDLPPPPAYLPPTQPSSSSSSFYRGDSVWGAPTKPTMSIVAPDPGTVLRGGFPEPSPAACGTRKLAELAAAQMLAGVAASGGNKPTNNNGHGAMVSSLDQHHHHHLEGDATPPPSQQSQGSSFTPPPPRLGFSLQIVNPETLGITYNETRKRSREGEPTTPWDGQLAQLVT